MHVAKGIFFTTTTFTEDAKREAKALGKVEIELVDLGRILSICEKHQNRTDRGGKNPCHGALLFSNDFESEIE